MTTSTPYRLGEGLLVSHNPVIFVNLLIGSFYPNKDQGANQIGSESMLELLFFVYKGVHMLAHLIGLNIQLDFLQSSLQ